MAVSGAREYPPYSRLNKTSQQKTTSLAIHLLIRVPVQTPTHSPFNSYIPAETTVNTVKLLSILMCQEPLAAHR